ncbi:hypothetical protein BYT27DRAFT_6447209 [Phlegmacium glaucopus]|nr:hypothetical protein BYT27DRAFT_6447209 [Phlegmacium glaucopus]
MRLSLTTFLTSTLAVSPFFSSPVSAIHPHVLSRRERLSSSLVVSSRQHSLPRSILDLCINVNVDLLADASQLLGLDPIVGPLGLGSNIQLCLCLKDLDIFLDTNVDIQALVGLLGTSTVSALITALINTSPGTLQCSFPPHAHHTCNNSDPCHYECDPHYVRVGDTCICAPPYTSCNGDCDIFPRGCGSAVPRSFKARNGPITTITQAKAICKPHETVCGIQGRESTLDFECINIDLTDDSCGGCMTPHPFFEADPVLHVAGVDCTRITNANISRCSGQRCIVSKCKVGWLPNLPRDRCVLDYDGPPKLREVLMREDSLVINAAANADLNSELLAKIGAIVKLVSGFSGLDCDLSPSQIPASSSSSAVVISDLLNGVSNATSTLIASTTIPSLLNNLDHLLNVSSLLSSTISSCGCETDLGLTGIEDALNNIVAASLNLESWCAQNVPIDFNLSGLLSELGLNTSTVAVGAAVSSDLVDQIKSFVGLVVGLAGVSSSLPPPSPGSGGVPMSPTDRSSINTNIINSIINATADIINAPTATLLVSGIGALVNVTGLASSLLDHCGCVNALGLGPLSANLAQVVNAALGMKVWCDTYPVASIPKSPATGSPSAGASTSVSNTDNLPIDVGLSNLLGLLGLVGYGVAIGGLGTDTSTLASGLLGTGDVSPVTAASGVVNPALVTQLDNLENLVTELQASCSPSGPTSLDASTLLDPNLVADVVQKAVNLLDSPTAISLVANIDALITANSDLQTALTNCTCADILGLDGMVKYLVLVSNAALGLKNWCLSNPLVISQPVVSTPSPSLPPGTVLSASAASTMKGVPSTALTVTSEPTPSTFPVASTAGGVPIAIGLDHPLSGLGLNGMNGAVETFNGLGVGAADIRRRRIVVGRRLLGSQTLEP